MLRSVGHPNLAEARKVQDRGVSALGRPYVKNAMVNADGRSLSEAGPCPMPGMRGLGAAMLEPTPILMDPMHRAK